MHEEHAAARGDSPRPHEGNETGHRLAGVHRVEEQRFAPRRHRNRLQNRVVELAVARRVHRVGHVDVARVEHLGAADHRRELARPLRDPGALRGGIAPHADAVHRHRLADRPHAHQGARVGEPAPRSADHCIEPEASRPRLLHDLVGGHHVTEPAERGMVGAEMDHVRLAPLLGERPGETFQRRIRRRLVLAERKGVQRCAEEAVEQHVAGGAVEGVGVVHPLFELYVDVHPELARPGRGEPHEIRLHRAGDEHRVGGLRPRLAEVELELAHLVPAKGEPRAVVALDPQLDAQRRSEVRSGVERGRRMAEPSPWKPSGSYLDR